MNVKKLNGFAAVYGMLFLSFLRSCFPAFLVSCFPAFLLSCFPAFLLSCFPAFLPTMSTNPMSHHYDETLYDLNRIWSNYRDSWLNAERKFREEKHQALVREELLYKVFGNKLASIYTTEYPRSAEFYLRKHEAYMHELDMKTKTLRDSTIRAADKIHKYRMRRNWQSESQSQSQSLDRFAADVKATAKRGTETTMSASAPVSGATTTSISSQAVALLTAAVGTPLTGAQKPVPKETLFLLPLEDANPDYKSPDVRAFRISWVAKEFGRKNEEWMFNQGVINERGEPTGKSICADDDGVWDHIITIVGEKHARMMLDVRFVNRRRLFKRTRAE